jgi:hypothetical protein
MPHARSVQVSGNRETGRRSYVLALRVPEMFAAMSCDEVALDKRRFTERCFTERRGRAFHRPGPCSSLRFGPVGPVKLPEAEGQIGNNYFIFHALINLKKKIFMTIKQK